MQVDISLYMCRVIGIIAIEWLMFSLVQQTMAEYQAQAWL